MEQKQINLRDGDCVSLWQSEVVSSYSDSALDIAKIFDVVIVGAGITGLTTAILLQQQGKKCILLDGNGVGFGTTGGTTAHLNTFFDTTYPEVEKDFGDGEARLFAEAGKEGIDTIQELTRTYGIACDLEYREGILYSETEKETKQLLEILEASRRAGVDAVETRDNGIPVEMQFAVSFKDQAQFHPLKYCKGLLQEFIDLGGVILDQAFVSEVSSQDDLQIAHVGEQRIAGKSLVYATHVPPGVTIFNFECAAYRSYVLGIKLKNGDYPEALVYDMQEPYHYFRTHEIEGQPYLILGGEDHKTGHENPEQAFKALEDYTRKYYYVESVDYKWSSQYYVPSDGLPFIGLIPGESNTYVATGYNGNGMMLGTIAGKLISDLILGKENKYQKLFSPSRIKPVAGFSEFIKENADVAYHFVADRFAAEDIDSFKDLAAGTGAVVDYKGDQLAVYKDDQGKITALNPTCTHAGCTVKFNAEEKSWDCPCHGGRFDLQGQVISGPPRKNLVGKNVIN
ncbi:FAD-dependent oxidoreductase [Pedobacter duraquae]|uniref:Glycine/D-amino acid oxidase-like deaminating enzyme n=1 Tax=Pedobacter duraquae TaxID=425511 RepID=A0A4R6IEI6_9SPHI|nr:FAD-dependent oxidoreductase [Pedobacter duraquae]TDO20156.1 glycine/D-amino acid oxidase-like deaminating enzyme [Pedobacter duraquae]